MNLKPSGEKRRSCYLTEKQEKVLRALAKRNLDGSLLDVNQIIDAVRPGQPRGAMMTTLRHLVAHDLIRFDEKILRRDRYVRTFALTEAGLDLIRPRDLPAGSGV